jgi:hypothetical protein
MPSRFLFRETGDAQKHPRDTARPSPRGVIAIEDSVARRLPIPLRNQRVKLGFGSKTIPQQVCLFDHATIQHAFKLRQFADQSPQQRHVIHLCRTNQEHQREEYISSGSE